MGGSRAGGSDRPRLYRELARWWPLLSPPQDYAAESRQIGRVLRAVLERRRRGRARVLELGAGGGHSIVHLRDRFDFVAADLSPHMLAMCQRLNPGVPTAVGDMRSMRLPGQRGAFDAVLIHDAVDYLVTRRDVARTLATAAWHLRPGGVVVLAPTYTAETFDPRAYEADQHTDGRATLTCLSTLHDPDPDDERFELLLVVVLQEEPDGPVRVHEDRHRCGLFAAARWRAMLAAAGFDALDAGRWAKSWPHELFIGRRG